MDSILTFPTVKNWLQEKSTDKIEIKVDYSNTYNVGLYSWTKEQTSFHVIIVYDNHVEKKDTRGLPSLPKNWDLYARQAILLCNFDDV